MGHQARHESFSPSTPVNRRQVLKGIGTLGAALAFGKTLHLAQALGQTGKRSASSETGTGQIPRRPLGQTGIHVSALALGGWHLGAVKEEREALRIVHQAIDSGLTFMDNAWDNHKGTERRSDGEGAQRAASAGVSYDEGLYAWTR